MVSIHTTLPLSFIQPLLTPTNLKVEEDIQVLHDNMLKLYMWLREKNNKEHSSLLWHALTQSLLKQAIIDYLTMHQTEAQMLFLSKLVNHNRYHSIVEDDDFIPKLVYLLNQKEEEIEDLVAATEVEEIKKNNPLDVVKNMDDETCKQLLTSIGMSEIEKRKMLNIKNQLQEGKEINMQELMTIIGKYKNNAGNINFSKLLEMFTSNPTLSASLAPMLSQMTQQGHRGKRNKRR